MVSYLKCMSYKVLQECLSVDKPSEAYTCDSFSFDSFEAAFGYAKSWAIDEWEKANFSNSQVDFLPVEIR